MKYANKTEYELHYWRTQAERGWPKEQPQKYLDYLRHFGIDPAGMAGKVVTDVGCGPHGGVLQVLPESTVKIAVDALFPEFEQAGLLSLPEGTQRYDCRAEHLEQAVGLPKADYVFCTNALDHSPDPHADRVEDGIAGLVAATKEGGQICIWVHLRTEEQLDYGHDVAVTAERVLSALHVVARNVQLMIYEADPVGGGQRITLAGRWVI
jgi:hypothetical protein